MPITIPNIFVAGTKIEAAPVNSNFAELANAVDKRGDTLTGNLSANAGVTVDGVDLSTIPNTAGTFNPLFPQVVIGTADTNGIRLDLESGTLAVREGDDSAYAPLIASIVNLPSGGSINFNSGDVTITQSAPNQLTFAGADHATAPYTFSGTTNGYLFNVNNVNTGKAAIAFKTNGTTIGVIGLTGSYTGDASTNMSVFAETGYDFRVATNGSTTTKFMVDTSGNVGIGVTPSAWDNTRRVLQIGGSGSLWTNTSGMGFLFLSNNAYYDGTNYKYLNTDEASYYAQTTAGDHSFATAVSGTAGNNVSFGEKFRILNGGNVAIGATARLYLDGVAGTGDTYITEVVANNIRIVAGGNNVASFGVAGGAGAEFFGSLAIGAAQKFYLDGGVDTYIHENTANQIQLVGGNATMATATTNAVISAGAIGVGFASTNGGTSTGTAIVRNADTYFYLTSSSRRFKENISPAVVTDAQLDVFMATTPSWWDYKGQKNGALGFIAEDLAALPLDRYGFNPLVNYDGDGQVESNRDYALIAMHHLVIQRLERKIAALEARIH